MTKESSSKRSTSTSDQEQEKKPKLDPKSSMSAVETEQRELLIEAIYKDLMQDTILEEAFVFDRLTKLAKSSEWSMIYIECGACQQICKAYVTRAGRDIHGRDLNATTLDKCDCYNCGSSYPSMTYSRHLEKCLGMGRASRNVARMKLVD